MEAKGKKKFPQTQACLRYCRNITWDGDEALGDGNPREVSFSRVLGSDDKS